MITETVQRSFTLTSFNDSRSNVLGSSNKKLFVTMSPVYPKIFSHSPSGIEGIGNRYTLADPQVLLLYFCIWSVCTELSSPVSTRLGGAQLGSKLGHLMSPLASVLSIFVLSLPLSSKCQNSKDSFCEWICACWMKHFWSQLVIERRQEPIHAETHLWPSEQIWLQQVRGFSLRLQHCNSLLSAVCLVNTKMHETVTQWMEFYASVSEE